MKHYKHLTSEQRYQISALLKTGISQSQIARTLGIDKSTVSRELKRNTGKRGYRPKQTQDFFIKRKAKNSKTITEFGWCYIEELLGNKYSPEQITGRLRYLGWDDVPSHERIYQYVYADKKAGGKFYTHLRSQKTYRKRGYSNNDRRVQITGRIDIDQRPEEANNRERMGDYEGDTVIGKGHQGVIVTLVDRSTRETKIRVLPNRKADVVANTCVDMLDGEYPLSITFDNGKEFAHHQKMAEELSTAIYFAKPYHSWEHWHQ